MTDLLLNSNKDLFIENNDLVIGNSDEQQQKVLLVARKGDFKQSLGVGVGLSQWLKDTETADMISEINNQFTKDGMVVKKVAITNNQLEIDASYR